MAKTILITAPIDGKVIVVPQIKSFSIEEEDYEWEVRVDGWLALRTESEDVATKFYHEIRDAIEEFYK